MATTIGKLAAVLSLNSKKFTQGLKQAGQRTKGFSSKLKGLKVGVAAVAAAFALVGTVAIRKFISVVNAARESVDRLAKQSSKLGVAANALQAMRLAAERSGVEVRTFDMALQRLIRRVSEAAKGTGEAQGAIKELGLEAKSLAKLAPEDQMKVIADAMSRVTDQGDRVRLSFKLFDSEGVAVVNMLKDGSRGLQQAEKDVKALNLALTDTELKNVEQMNDRFGDVKRTVAAIGQHITAGIAPALTVMAEALLGNIREAQGFRRELNEIVELLVALFEFGGGTAARVNLFRKTAEALIPKSPSELFTDFPTYFDRASSEVRAAQIAFAHRADAPSLSELFEQRNAEFERRAERDERRQMLNELRKIQGNTARPNVNTGLAH